MGENGNWYFLRSDGGLVRWDYQPNQATGTQMAMLDPVVFERPELLYDARAEQYDVFFENGTLLVNVADDFTSEFWVEATVSDSVRAHSETFRVRRAADAP
ncbi:MAG: hypothetical protein L0215_08240 [Gemmataceae bacterium]|nr:hypothetical protein [Gemmataceae bacterium]